MKRFLFICLTLIIAFSFSSCKSKADKSKEEKAAELISKELSKTLYDFDSYEPIETIVKEACQTAYNDTTCLRLAATISLTMDKGSNAFNEAQGAKDFMDIWGTPTYYSSSYSDRQYYKYRDKFIDKHNDAVTYFSTAKMLGESLEESIKFLDSTKIIGWEVNHRFRCKTRGGLNDIRDYRYIIDKEFKAVIFKEDMDDKNSAMTRAVIDDAAKGFFSSLEPLEPLTK